MLKVAERWTMAHLQQGNIELVINRGALATSSRQETASDCMTIFVIVF